MVSTMLIIMLGSSQNVNRPFPDLFFHETTLVTLSVLHACPQQTLRLLLRKMRANHRGCEM